jgi:hypothetical protein
MSSVLVVSTKRSAKQFARGHRGGILTVSIPAPARTASNEVVSWLAGAVEVGAGIVALAYPGLAAVTLVVIIAIWAIVFGVLELSTALVRERRAGTRGWFVIAGLVSIAFGVVLAARPGPMGLRDHDVSPRRIRPRTCGRPDKSFDVASSTSKPSAVGVRTSGTRGCATGVAGRYER